MVIMQNSGYFPSQLQFVFSVHAIVQTDIITLGSCQNLRFFQLEKNASREMIITG